MITSRWTDMFISEGGQWWPDSRDHTDRLPNAFMAVP